MPRGIYQPIGPGSGNSGGGSGGGVFTLGSVPASNTSPGSPYTVAWDGGGNMYVCYLNSTWAKYLNTAPFGGGDAQPLGMP